MRLLSGAMWRFYWNDGTTEDVEGATIEEAFANSKYTLLSLALMDAYEDITPPPAALP